MSAKGAPASRAARYARRRKRRMARVEHDLTPGQWVAIQAAWGGCAYCQADDQPLQRDCVLPIAHGGRYTRSNVWTAIAQTPPSRERSLAAEVMEYFDAQLDIAEAHPQLFRDYWAAYVARVQHADNEARLTDVIDAIAQRWCQHAGRPAPDEEALLAAYTMFSTYSVTILGICTGLDTPRYRGYLRAIVERECRPAEPNAAGLLPAMPRVVPSKPSLETIEDLKGQA